MATKESFDLVIIGTVPGGSCMGAGYEYLFNFDQHVRKDGVRDQVPIVWVTPMWITYWALTGCCEAGGRPSYSTGRSPAARLLLRDPDR